MPMRALLALFLLLPGLPAAALDLLPTTLQLPAEGGRTELWLHNPGPERWQGEVQILAWEQQLDAERLQPSDRILASPTRLDLAPGARQRVWLLPRSAVPVAAEQAYRIVLAPGRSSLPRYSLPLFQGAAAPSVRPAVRARVESNGSQTHLRLDNPGRLHARLDGLSFESVGGHRSVLLPGLAGYVLAGRERRWTLPARRDGYLGGRFRARLQDGREVVLDAWDPSIAVNPPAGL